VALGGFHPPPYRVLDTPVVSLVAVEPSGTGLPSTLGSRGSIGAEPSYRASV
jgi:hypothetical protein